MSWLKTAAGIVLFVYKVVTVRPSDKDAKMRYTECDKVVKRIAFERAIASDESKSIADQINIDTMGNCWRFYFVWKAAFYLSLV